MPLQSVLGPICAHDPLDICMRDVDVHSMFFYLKKHTLYSEGLTWPPLGLS